MFPIFFALAFLGTAANSDVHDGNVNVRSPDGGVSYSFPANKE